MSHGKIRAEKFCENCYSYVPDRYCSHCGQENIETKQPFYFLITHFFEDFTHYDNGFWQTLKNLFLKPGFLTVQYLSGKRQSMVNPVKLYIFISFVTFLFLAVLPSKTMSLVNENGKSKIEMHKGFDFLIEIDNTPQTNLDNSQINQQTESSIITEVKHNPDEFASKFFTNLYSFIPKVLFLYMPFFAFLLWLFNNKKEWWYFDHGIFTLHYFSMLLLTIAFVSGLNALFFRLSLPKLNFVAATINIGLAFYVVLYFYIALYKVYKQNLIKTIVKGSVLSLINFICIIIVTVVIFIYAYLKTKG